MGVQITSEGITFFLQKKDVPPPVYLAVESNNLFDLLVIGDVVVVGGVVVALAVVVTLAVVVVVGVDVVAVSTGNSNLRRKFTLSG